MPTDSSDLITPSPSATQDVTTGDTIKASMTRLAVCAAAAASDRPSPLNPAATEDVKFDIGVDPATADADVSALAVVSSYRLFASHHDICVYGHPRGYRKPVVRVTVSQAKKAKRKAQKVARKATYRARRKH